MAPVTQPPQQGRTIDVSALPTITFGASSMMWWGTLGFMIIEGWTLALGVMSYLYLRQNQSPWPPQNTPHPDLLLPTISLGVMLLSLVPTWYSEKRAEKLDRAGILKGLAGLIVLATAVIVLRWYELGALNTRWDSDAYGSIAWLIVGLHYTLLILDLGDSIGLAVLMRHENTPPHFYADATDNAHYYYFTVAAWIPLYFLVYVAPRFI